MYEKSWIMWVTVAVIIVVPLVLFNLNTEFARATITEPAVSISNNTQARAAATSAESIFHTNEMILGPNVSYLVILIPNEAHESPALSEEQRLIGQPYIPQSAVINPRTSVVWFNGDVDHDRKITLTKGDETILNGDEFEYNNALGPFRLNETGGYTYFENDVNNDDPDFVMQGNISVTGGGNNNETSNTSVNDNLNIQMMVGSIVVPAQNLQQYTSQLQNGGLDIDSSYNFTDLMSGQTEEGTAAAPEDEQTLLVWTANANEVTLDQVIQTLQGITRILPYE